MSNAPIDPTYISAVRDVMRLFKGDPAPDKRTIHEIYVANNRDLSKVETNKAWRRENMTLPRRYKLAEVITADDNKTVVGVQLSEKGKEAIREALAEAQEVAEAKPSGEPQDQEEHAAGQPPVNPITADVVIKGGSYPSLTITLNINFQGGTVQVT